MKLPPTPVRTSARSLVNCVVGPALRFDQTPCPTSSLFDEASWNTLAQKIGLSERMLQIVKGVFDDKTEYAIASELAISEHTVHTYFERIRHKLGVNDRVQLILRVTQAYLQLAPRFQPNEPELVLASEATCQSPACEPSPQEQADARRA